MNISVKALVLKVQTVSVSDRICTLLTDKLGIIRAVARGANNIKNKNFTSTAQFVYGRFELFRTRERYIIDESAHEQLFVQLREDIERLSLAQYMCSLAAEIVPAETAAEEYLHLAVFALNHLAAGDRSPEIVKAAFELRMLAAAGYMPDLVMCAGCGAYEVERMEFYPVSGVILCADCAKKAAEEAEERGELPALSLSLCRSALYAMRHIVYSELGKVFSFALADAPLAQLAAAAEKYMLVCVDRSFSALEFYRAMVPPIPASRPGEE